MLLIMWLLSLKLWTPQFGFVVYLKIILWITAHMVNLRKKIYHHFKYAHIIILPIRTTNKHTLPLPTKQPTLSKQCSSSFQNVHHHMKAFCSQTTNSFKAPTLPFHNIRSVQKLLWTPRVIKDKSPKPNLTSICY